MLPEKLQKLIQIFQKFPGAGPHQAARIAFWFLNQSKASQEQLIQALNEARTLIGQKIKKNFRQQTIAPRGQNQFFFR